MSARPWLNFGVCAVAIFFVWLDSTCMPTLLPTLRQAWPDASPAEVGWVLNAYLLSFALLLVPMGRLTDRLGSWRTLRLGLAGFALTSALCAAASSLGELIVARALQGAAAACLTPAALVWALKPLPAARHSRAMYVWAAVGGLAAAAGPLLATLAHQTSWRSVFALHLLACLVAGVLLHRLHPVGARAEGAPVDAQPGPLLPPGQGGFWWVQASTLAFGAAFALIVMNVQQTLMERLALSHGQASLWLCLAIMVCVATSLGLAFSRLGHQAARLTMAGCALCALSGWCLLALDSTATGLGLLATLALAGVGLGMALPNFPSISIHAVPERMRGVAQAVNQSSRHLGSALGIAVAPLASSPQWSLGTGLTLCCLASAVLLAMASAPRSNQSVTASIQATGT